MFYHPMVGIFLVLNSLQLPMNQNGIRSCIFDEDICSFSLYLSPDGKRLALGGGTQKGGDWKILDLTNGKTLVQGKGRCWGTWTIRISPSGSLVASGGNRNWLFLSDAKTGNILWDLSKEGDFGSIKHVFFTPDEKFLISSYWDDRQLQVWDIKAKKARAVFLFNGYTLHLWSFNPGNKKHPEFFYEVEGKYNLGCPALTPNGKLLAIVGDGENKVSFLDLGTGKVVRKEKGDIPDYFSQRDWSKNNQVCPLSPPRSRRHAFAAQPSLAE